MKDYTIVHGGGGGDLKPLYTLVSWNKLPGREKGIGKSSTLLRGGMYYVFLSIFT